MIIEKQAILEEYFEILGHNNQNYKGYFYFKINGIEKILELSVQKITKNSIQKLAPINVWQKVFPAKPNSKSKLGIDFHEILNYIFWTDNSRRLYYPPIKAKRNCSPFDFSLKTDFPANMNDWTLWEKENWDNRFGKDGFNENRVKRAQRWLKNKKKTIHINTDLSNRRVKLICEHELENIYPFDSYISELDLIEAAKREGFIIGFQYPNEEKSIPSASFINISNDNFVTIRGENSIRTIAVELTEFE